MIGWAQLRDAAGRPLPVRDAAAVAPALGGRRLKLGDVGRRASWPPADDISKAIADARARLSPPELAQLVDLMLSPERAYVLAAPETEQRYALIGSWEGPEIAWAQITIRPDASDGQRLDLQVTALPTDAPGLADELRALFAEIDPRHAPRSDPTRRTLDRAMWVGGSPGEAGCEHWQHAVAALLASRGLDVEFFARPGDATLDEALRRVERFRGAVTIVWKRRAGDSYRSSRLLAASKGNPVVLLELDFELALTEAAVALDEIDQDRAEELRQTPGPADDEQQGLAGGPFYFKKTGAGSGGYGDRMQLMSGPCIHNAFRRARRPDQAKRGIARVAKAEPTRLEHCDRCTGGGFWRVWF